MNSIKQLQPSDNAEFRALWTSALIQHEEFFRTSIDDDAEPSIPTQFSQDSFTLGAFDGGELVGILSLKRDRKVKLDHKALLFGMYVKPSSVNQGFGRLLLQEAISRAERNPAIRQVYLTVLASNARAQRLYLSAGFEVFATEPRSVKIQGCYIDEYQMVLFV